MSEEMLHTLRLMHERLSILESGVQDLHTGSSQIAQPSQGIAQPWLAAHDAWEQTKLDALAHFLGGDTVWTEDKLKTAVDLFNYYLKLLLKRYVDFRFQAKNIEFLTITDISLVMAQFVRNFFTYKPTVLEAFAGCGADTIMFLGYTHPARIYCCETDPENMELLKGNVARFREGDPKTANTAVTYHQQTAGEFITTLPEPKPKQIKDQQDIVRIDVLYLDPPWVLPGTTTEATPDALTAWLDTEVFEPMSNRGYLPKLIVMKTRFGYEEMKVLNQTMYKQYSHIETIHSRPFKGEFYFHILVNNTIYDYSDWVPGDNFNHVYRRAARPDGNARPPETRMVAQRREKKSVSG